MDGARKLSGVTRIDLERGGSAEWIVPAGHVPGEPVLVPRGEAEDDAWILDLVHDRPGDHSYLAVLDRERMEDGPVVDHPIPVTFHGTFRAQQ